METLTTEIQSVLSRLWQVVFQPWTLYQIFILTASYLVARLISRKFEPQLETWLRQIKLSPGLLRVFAALVRRLEWILFSVFTGTAYLVIVNTTWPSRAFFIKLGFALAIAWLFIAVASRILHSRALSNTVAILAWIIVALNITGTFSLASNILDSLAFTMGDMRLSLLLVIKALALLIGLIWLATSVGKYAEARVKDIADLTPSLQVLIGKFVKIFLVVLAIVVALSSVGVDLTALTIFSGAVGVGLGFGLQKVVSNFISGVIILLDKSIKPGDTISLGETFGWIRELRSRFVSVVTRDGREFLIPNEDFITEKVINWSFTDKLVRLDVKFGVSYDSNPHDVTSMVIEAAGSVERVSNHKKPVCWMTEFGDSSLNFVVRFWISDPQNGLTNIRGQVLLALWDAFQENDVGITYPHREIIMRPQASPAPTFAVPNPASKTSDVAD